MVDLVTLILPEGAWDYPSSHGTQEYYPYQLIVDHNKYPARENTALWGVDVPQEIFSYFTGAAGFRVMPTDEPVLSQEEIVMKRLRKIGDTAGCNWRGQFFEAGADGIVTVPHMAVGELVESHGYEEVVEEVQDAHVQVTQPDQVEHVEGTKGPEEGEASDAPVARGRQVPKR